VRLGGLIRLSTLDYPGLLSAVVFTQVCNFRCPYCHNPGLARPSGGPLDVAGVLAVLRERRRFLDGVVVSGGEPTILGGLPGFLRRVRALGYSLKLDTNGSRPGALGDVLGEGLVDYVAMDLKADPDRYPQALAPGKEGQGIRESIMVLKRSGVPHEFRTTVASPFVDDSSLDALSRAASGGRPLFLQRLDLSRGVLDPAFMGAHPAQPGPGDLARLQAIARRHLPCHIR
jgi:pyruvate formate lyase activating enzyme